VLALPETRGIDLTAVPAEDPSEGRSSVQGMA
jgi:hypothetical protein